jgi:hypothetical protein
VTVNTVSRWENGRVPSSGCLLSIRDFLDVDLAVVLDSYRISLGTYPADEATREPYLRWRDEVLRLLTNGAVDLSMALRLANCVNRPPVELSEAHCESLSLVIESLVAQ